MTFTSIPTVEDFSEATTPEEIGDLLARTPIDWGAYAAHLRRRADEEDASDGPAITDPSEIFQALRAEAVRALVACRKDGAVSRSLAQVVFDAIGRWHMLSEQRKRDTISASFAEARRLMETYGQDDLRAVVSMIDAIELQDPEYIFKANPEGWRPPKA